MCLNGTHNQVPCLCSDWPGSHTVQKHTAQVTMSKSASPLVTGGSDIHMPCLYDDTVAEVHNATLTVREATIVEDWRGGEP